MVCFTPMRRPIVAAPDRHIAIQCVPYTAILATMTGRDAVGLCPHKILGAKILVGLRERGEEKERGGCFWTGTLLDGCGGGGHPSLPRLPLPRLTLCRWHLRSRRVKTAISDPLVTVTTLSRHDGLLDGLLRGQGRLPSDARLRQSVCTRRRSAHLMAQASAPYRRKHTNEMSIYLFVVPAGASSAASPRLEHNGTLSSGRGVGDHDDDNVDGLSGECLTLQVLPPFCIFPQTPPITTIA